MVVNMDLQQENKQILMKVNITNKPEVLPYHIDRISLQ